MKVLKFQSVFEDYSQNSMTIWWLEWVRIVYRSFTLVATTLLVLSLLYVYLSLIWLEFVKVEYRIVTSIVCIGLVCWFVIKDCILAINRYVFSPCVLIAKFLHFVLLGQCLLSKIAHLHFEINIKPLSPWMICLLLAQRLQLRILTHLCYIRDREKSI